MYRAIRFPENPVIHSRLDSDVGTNINGPALIRVPDWVVQPLGRYYLYFAHHQGAFIRLAYADSLHGPWTVYRGGVLRLDETSCRGHIASPDVQVLAARQEIVMYFHGVTHVGQRTFRATSADGLHFQASPEVLGPFYFRVFQHDEAWFAIAKLANRGGVLLRSRDGTRGFEVGPHILPRQRHVAVLKKKDEIHIFYSRCEDGPERILLSTMSLKGDWRRWRPSEPIEILRPEMDYEGGPLPIRPSRSGPVYERVCELRDPAIYEENGRLYLLYTGAGETAICIAELIEHRA